ncbi:HAD family hydrolase [Actinomadura sp. HBU206391]|uniref:HAD family hydrolase n=1 Tax=Actinomadura sp. HBU206391 TaxID=2731692 RepID=UPI00164F6579|nr:beta-phosphoglucomutase family hydrolase [Actinomadura sp. HBU206391]MBC6460945.1 beta-phosphoglucomutase family hydrolase [Actinomadura sp. HBU206391]
MFGVPDSVQACLFDLDGVLTRTAAVHAAAWRQMFDEFLRARADRTGEPFVPFDPARDYSDYVDGRPREDGTRSFLASRGIDLPEGAPGDPPGTPTVHGLSERKNELVLHRMAEDGVEVFEGSVEYVRAVRGAGLRTAVVSSSANTAQVLDAAGLADLFDARVDGLVAGRLGLAGKPAPDTYLAGAKALGVLPERAAVFEDALAGVAAGRAGGFAVVIGVDRVGHRRELLEHGADLVVDDLVELLEHE